MLAILVFVDCSPHIPCGKREREDAKLSPRALLNHNL
jgi:hypothetical protein